MDILIIVLVALAPCAFWLWMIYLWDKCRPAQKSMMIRTFFLGMGIAIPVAIIETLLYPGSVQGNLSIAAAAYAAFIVAGVVEESGKFLGVRLGAYRSIRFDQPEDGLIYASAVALGFAAMENVVYILSFGLSIILARGLFSNLAHVLFASIWGYPLVLTKLGVIKNRYLSWVGLGAAMATHGLFDFLLFTSTALVYLVIPLFIAMIILFVIMMRHANKIATCKLE
jgi:RsiW-degrading membrane proteinase PrsW (M82 family)